MAVYLGTQLINEVRIGTSAIQNVNMRLSQTIPSNGLIALFDATNATSYTGTNAWYDLSPNRLVATVFSGSSFPTYDSTLKELQFNGTTNVIYAPISASVTTGSIINNFTQIMWVKVPDLGGPAESGVINLQDSNKATINFDAISFDQTSNKWKLTSDNANRNVVATVADTTFNSYVMVAGTRASGASNFIIYRDGGNNIGSGTYTPYTYTATSNNASAIVMGNRFFNNPANSYAGDGFFSGSLSSVIMYNRVLSSTELDTIYSAGRFGINL